MITNARILRIDTAQTAGTPDGGDLFTTGDAVDLPCFLDAVTRQQFQELGAKIREANWVTFVDSDDLADSGLVAPAVGDQVVVVSDTPGGDPGDEADAILGVVLLARTRVLGSVSHAELYVKVA